MFFYFNQKTSYDVRMSDWVSDVCSSGLLGQQPHRHDLAVAGVDAPRLLADLGLGQGRQRRARTGIEQPRSVGGFGPPDGRLGKSLQANFRSPGSGRDDFRRRRSEEHTSELQSLMRISYAVFCLKKKKK